MNTHGHQQNQEVMLSEDVSGAHPQELGVMTVTPKAPAYLYVV